MSNREGRREFFGSSGNMLAAFGLASQVPAHASPNDHPASKDSGPDYYDKLGVAKIINAAGTYTYLTASTMPPEVQAAVAEAAKHPVRLRDLQKAAGEYLARKLQCDGALVTCGAASALTIGTAACLSLQQSAKPEDIPARVGAKREMLIQKGHRFSHDHALEMAGVKLVEV